MPYMYVTLELLVLVIISTTKNQFLTKTKKVFPKLGMHVTNYYYDGVFILHTHNGIGKIGVSQMHNKIVRWGLGVLILA